MRGSSLGSQGKVKTSNFNLQKLSCGLSRVLPEQAWRKRHREMVDGFQQLFELEHGHSCLKSVKAGLCQAPVPGVHQRLQQEHQETGGEGQPVKTCFQSAWLFRRGDACYINGLSQPRNENTFHKGVKERKTVSPAALFRQELLTELCVCWKGQVKAEMGLVLCSRFSWGGAGQLQGYNNPPGANAIAAHLQTYDPES